MKGDDMVSYAVSGVLAAVIIGYLAYRKILVHKHTQRPGKKNHHYTFKL